MRILTFFLLFIVNAFAIDATMEIIKQAQKLPTIRVENITPIGEGRDIGDRVATMLAGDLKVSGHFEAFSMASEGSIDYIKLRQSGVDMLATVSIGRSFDGVIADYTLYDVNAQRSVESKMFSIREATSYPFLAHKIAISINDYLGAPKIDWMDRFVVVAKQKSKKESEIVIADYTLTYQKPIIIGGLNIFPKWANREQTKLYYTNLDDKPSLYVIDIYSGAKQKLLDSPGMIICSDVSEDGSKLLLTMARYDDQPDIFLYDTKNQGIKRITAFSGIDVGGHFIDGEQRVAFVSDRLGSPNIFATSVNGGAVEQLVYHGKNNVSLTAYDHYIAYSSREDKNEFGRNTFNLYLISTQSNFIRRLTAEGINEFPRFSRDGQSLLFIKNLRSESALGIIRLNYNKSFIFPLRDGKIQSLDW